jgi:hypothetical protein
MAGPFRVRPLMRGNATVRHSGNFAMARWCEAVEKYVVGIHEVLKALSPAFRARDTFLKVVKVLPALSKK